MVFPVLCGVIGARPVEEQLAAIRTITSTTTKRLVVFISGFLLSFIFILFLFPPGAIDHRLNRQAVVRRRRFILFLILCSPSQLVPTLRDSLSNFLRPGQGLVTVLRLFR